MIIKKEIKMAVNQSTRLNLRFSSDLTRIASSLDGVKSTGGFTKYFRQLKRKAEKDGTADDYVFIFSLDEYKAAREQFNITEGKVIIIDNAGISLFSDEEMLHCGNLTRLKEKNQLIVRDYTSEDDDVHADLEEDALNIGYLTEVHVTDENGNTCKEIRLAYRNRLDYRTPISTLFIDEWSMWSLELDLKKMNSAEESIGSTELAESVTNLLGEFGVLDVTDWEDTSIVALLNSANVKIYADRELPEEVLGEVYMYIQDNQVISGTGTIKHHDDHVVLSLVRKMGAKASKAMFIGPPQIKGIYIEDIELCVWSPKDDEEISGDKKEYVTMFLIPDLQSITYGIEPLENGRYAYRVAGTENLPLSDVHALFGEVMEKTSRYLSFRNIMGEGVFEC